MTSYDQRPFAVPASATEVILARHGASAAIAAGESFALDAHGHGDPPLAPAGERQAEALAQALAAAPLAGIFVTGLRRTVQTAAPLAARLGIEPVVVPELREVHLGEWEGGEWRVRVAERDPLAVRVLTEERWDLIPGGESMESFGRRVRAGLETVVAALGPGASGLAVVHGGVIGELCRQAAGSRAFAMIHADNASLTRLVVFPDGRWLLRSFNEIAHL